MSVLALSLPVAEACWRLLSTDSEVPAERPTSSVLVSETCEPVLAAETDELALFAWTVVIEAPAVAAARSVPSAVSEPAAVPTAKVVASSVSA